MLIAEWDHEEYLVKAVFVVSIATLLFGIALFYVSNRKDDLNTTIIAAGNARIQFEATSEDLLLANDLHKYVGTVPLNSFMWMAYYGLSGIEPTSSLSPTNSTTMADYLVQVSNSINDYNNAITALDNESHWYGVAQDFLFWLESILQLITVILASRLSVISARRPARLG